MRLMTMGLAIGKMARIYGLKAHLKMGNHLAKEVDGFDMKVDLKVYNMQAMERSIMKMAIKNLLVCIECPHFFYGARLYVKGKLYFKTGQLRYEGTFKRLKNYEFDKGTEYLEEGKIITH